MAKSFLIYVQHLLGSGHYVRAYHLANALAHQNHRVHLVTGGFPVTINDNDRSQYLIIKQLPPIKSPDEHFNQLVSIDGSPVTEEYKTNRKNQLLDYVRNHSFDCAIIETFPFGRRQLRYEIIPMLESLKAQQPECKIFSSIRDILQHRSHERALESVQYLNQYFDGVLVHSDEHFVELSDSFQLTDEIANKLHYTGYLYPKSDRPQTHSKIAKDKKKTIIVAAGGSNQGYSLLKTAILASDELSNIELVWHVLYSPHLSREAIESLTHLAALRNHVICEPNRHDYKELLMNADLSISYAGYNTVLDILNSQIKSILIPFNKGQETEQTSRVNALEKRGRAIVFNENGCNPIDLATCVERAFQLSTSSFTLPNMNGIENSCEFLNNALQRH